jgi:hypothetical protein
MAQKKDKVQYGMFYAPDCDFQVYEINNNTGWAASIKIGFYHYETDYYDNKQDAIDEQRGCLLVIKEQIEKYLEKLD